MQLIYINQLPLQLALLEQRADSANDVSPHAYVFDYLDAGFACLWQVGVIATKPRKQVLAFVLLGNRLLYLVRPAMPVNCPSSLPGLVRKISLYLAQSLRALHPPLAFGHVYRWYRRILGHRRICCERGDLSSERT